MKDITRGEFRRQVGEVRGKLKGSLNSVLPQVTSEAGRELAIREYKSLLFKLSELEQYVELESADISVVDEMIKTLEKSVKGMTVEAFDLTI